VRQRERNLFDEIQRDALAEDASLAATLRKVIALGGDVGSTKLRDWAHRELQGYVGLSDDEIPDYRKVPALILIDGVKLNVRITNQQISRFDFPAQIREHVEERVTFVHGVGELESLLSRAKSDGVVKLGIRGGPELAKMMNFKMERQGLGFQVIERVYHAVAEPSLAGVLDAIRTALVTLVSEMRAGMPNDAEAPSAAVADQAVNIAVHGDQNRVQIAQASGDGSHEVYVGRNVRGESRGTKFWVALGSLVGVAVLVVTVFIWQGWWT